MANELQERSDIIEIVNRVYLNTDLREWTELRKCFYNEVEVDYTSMFGGEPQRLSADGVIKSWDWLKEFQVTHHQVSCHVVTLQGDRAWCHVHVHATHHLPNDKGDGFWTCGELCDFGLRRTSQGWRVERLKATIAWARGNQDINQLAQSRAEAQSR